MILSKSSISAFMRCPRAWKYTYIDKKVPRSDDDSTDLQFGSAFHKCIEDNRDVFPEAGLSNTSTVIGSALWFGYKNMYRPLGGKVEYEWEFGGLRGIFDELAPPAIRETKTTRTRVDDSYWEVLPLNNQLRMYLWAARELDLKCNTVLWDVIKRPQPRPRRGETPEKFVERVNESVYENRHDIFMRQEVTLTEENLDDFERDLFEFMLMIQNRVYPKNGDSCRAFGRLCGYHPICIGEATIDNEELYMIRKKR